MTVGGGRPNWEKMAGMAAMRQCVGCRREEIMCVWAHVSEVFSPVGRSSQGDSNSGVGG